ncbi:MAG: oppA [Thermoleophilia bacterium]|nr:oppA [Thermoleophilia bacterium]
MSVKFQKLMSALAVLAAASFVAVGCGSDDSDDGGGGKDLVGKQELIVNQGEEAEPGNFIPAGMSYLDAVNTKGYTQFAGLYRLEGQENEVVPALATEKPEISEDGLTYTITMRDDAEWSDGKPIVAADLVAAVQHALDPATGAYFAGFLKDIVGACERLAGDDAKALNACPAPRTTGKPDEIGVVAKDDTTIEIKLNKPVPWFEQLLTIQIFYPLRADELKKLGKDYGKDPATSASGPFKFVSYKPGGDIVFEKNDKYYDADKVKLDRLVFKTVAEAKTASADFKRGRLDTGIQNVMFDAADVDQWKADDRFISNETVGTQYMYMNTRNKELSDPKVRQALALAVNRKDIVDNIRKIGDKPAVGVVPPAVPGYDVWGEGSQDFLNTDGTPNTDKAKSLLDEAGWDKNETLNLYYISDSGNAPTIAKQIQANLGEVGVKVELKPTNGDTFSTTGIGISPTKGDVDLMLQGWIQDYLDAQDWYQLFYSGNIEAGLNSANYDSPEFDKLYDEALKTVDNDARYEIYKEMEAKLSGPEGDMPVAPLYVQADATLVQPWVSGMELIPSGIIYWENVAITGEKKK